MNGDPLLPVSGPHEYFTQNDSFIDCLLGANEAVKAVNDTSFDIECGEMLGFVSESGSGKLTAAQSILWLDGLTKGAVNYNGTDLTVLSDRGMAEVRKHIQIVFQDPAPSLDRQKAVGQIIKQPMEIHGPYEDERDARVDELIETTGLPPQCSNRYLHEFSGGQRRRVGIAHVLAVDLDFIVVDEPVPALDASIQAQTLNLLDDLQEEFNLTLLFIAHNPSTIRYVYNCVAMMYLGGIVELVDANELLSNPQHPYTRTLLGAIPQPMPEFARQRQVLEGEVPLPLGPPSGRPFNPRCPAATEECTPADPALGDAASATGGHKTTCIYVDEFETGAGVPSATQDVDERLSIEDLDAGPTLIIDGRGGDDR